MERETKAYSHRTVIKHFPDLQQLIEQRTADYRQVIIVNNLNTEPLLQQIREKVLVKMQTEARDPHVK